MPYASKAFNEAGVTGAAEQRGVGADEAGKAGCEGDEYSKLRRSCNTKATQ